MQLIFIFFLVLAFFTVLAFLCTLLQELPASVQGRGGSLIYQSGHYHIKVTVS